MLDNASTIPFFIDPAKGLIRSDATGLILTKDLLVRTIDAIFADPAYVPTFNTIHDFSNIIRMDLTPQDLDEIIRADMRETPHLGRQGLVMGKNISNRIFAELYVAKVEGARNENRIQLTSRVFETMDDAENWVFDNAA